MTEHKGAFQHVMPSNCMLGHMYCFETTTKMIVYVRRICKMKAHGLDLKNLHGKINELHKQGWRKFHLLLSEIKDNVSKKINLLLTSFQTCHVMP